MATMVIPPEGGDKEGHGRDVGALPGTPSARQARGGKAEGDWARAEHTTAVI